MLRYLTAGESHGPGILAILEGLPANLPLTAEDINADLQRRQGGYGRGGRMKIEKDEAQILSGVRGGRTLGSPIALLIRNKDWENWKEIMAAGPEAASARREVTRPRPGHADLAGALKYDQRDIRNILERASARETSARVAVGAAAKRLLAEFGIRATGHVVEIGRVKADLDEVPLDGIRERAESSEVRCADPKASRAMIEHIDEARARGTSLGGIFEVIVTGAPVGLGSHVHWDRKLDGRLAQALMSIQAIKGVEVGLGFEAARRFGLEVHDEIGYDPNRPAAASRFARLSNRAGGLEGGTTNGEPVVVRAAMKPLSTQMTPLQSVDLASKETAKAAVERSDVCAVPAAAVIGEAVVAFEVARALCEKFGGDSLAEMQRNHSAYLEYLASR
ncbi:MAG TPA: chorismate synthase [Candidatus Sulfotelmatobacter sp.]|nr:chorismate synthase [Candidatus Sulfotelmatobacter sp.]